MKLVYGGYGHSPSGKQYVYYGSDNLRTGQHVVAPVTDKNTGKTYNTMFTVMRTSKEGALLETGETERLTDAGIDIKTIGGRDTLSLPTGQQFESKAAWERASKSRRTEEVRERLLSSNTSNSNTMARNRLIGD